MWVSNPSSNQHFIHSCVFSFFILSHCLPFCSYSSSRWTRLRDKAALIEGTFLMPNFIHHILTNKLLSFTNNLPFIFSCETRVHFHLFKFLHLTAFIFIFPFQQSNSREFHCPLHAVEVCHSLHNRYAVSSRSLVIPHSLLISERGFSWSKCCNLRFIMNILR